MIIYNNKEKSSNTKQEPLYNYIIKVYYTNNYNKEGLFQTRVIIILFSIIQYYIAQYQIILKRY